MHFPFMNRGSYPYTNLDTLNLDWFIDDAFRMKDFVKREVEDIYRMKEWVLKNMVKVDVIAELVAAVAIKAEDKKKIKENLDIAEGGKIDGIKVNGQPVDIINKVAEITLPDPPEIPVTDVKVNGVSILIDKIANIIIPKPPEIPVTDVRVNGQTAMDGTVAKVKSATKVNIAGSISSVQDNGEVKFTPIDVGYFVSDGIYTSKEDGIKRKLKIPITEDDYRTATGIINVEGVEF